MSNGRTRLDGDRILDCVVQHIDSRGRSLGECRNHAANPKGNQSERVHSLRLSVLRSQVKESPSGVDSGGSTKALEREKAVQPRGRAARARGHTNYPANQSADSQRAPTREVSRHHGALFGSCGWIAWLFPTRALGRHQGLVLLPFRFRDGPALLGALGGFSQPIDDLLDARQLGLGPARGISTLALCPVPDRAHIHPELVRARLHNTPGLPSNRP